jgi:hypothetical protein
MQVNAALASGTTDPPTELAVTGDWCEDCDFGAVCPEYAIASAGLSIAPQEIVELVERRAQLAPTHREYNQVSKLLSKHWSRVPPGEYLCGDYVVKVTQVPEKQIEAYTRASYNRASYRKVAPERRES